MSQLPKVSSEELLRREQERKRRIGIENAMQTMKMYFDWRVQDAQKNEDDDHLINVDHDSEKSRKSV